MHNNSLTISGLNTQTTASKIGDLYYRAQHLWQVCNEKNINNKMICFNSNIPAFVFKNLERKTMKTELECMKVNPNHITTIYRCSLAKSGPDGSTQFGNYLEAIVAEEIPYDVEVYLVPALFEDSQGNEARGLAIYGSLFQMIRGGYIINEDGSLSPLNESKLLDTNNGIATELLIQPEGFDTRVASLSEKMPDKIEWGDFYSEEAYLNVGYAFKMVSSSPLDVDFDALRKQKELSGEIDYEDGMECTGVYQPNYVLHKVFISRLPVVGSLFYIPVEINFNDKQQRKGYALFDSQQQEVLDVYFYDKSFGQLSAMKNSEMLEDCGLFKNEKLFNYKILLSNC